MLTAVPTRVEDVDLFNPDFFLHGDPHAAWRLLRAQDPLHRNPQGHIHWRPAGREVPYSSFWNVTKYDDIVAVSRDPSTFISSRGINLNVDRIRPEGGEADEQMRQMAGSVQGRMLIMSDPPRHTKLRQLVNRGFTPRATAHMRSHIHDIATQIIDDVAGRGECDFVVDVSAKLPLAVICELMGVPKDDWEMMFDVTNRAIGSGDPEYQVDDGGQGMQMQAFAYFSQMVQERRITPREDLVTTLVDSQIDGEKLEDIDILLFCFLLIVAGNETTRNATTGGMLALMQHPEQHQRLLEDRSLVPSAVEEILRWTSPVMHMTRVATRDTELRGKQISEGDRLAMWYPSANRDEEVFDDPYTFDVTRKPNEHLAFGIGEHFCLGANLARLELIVMFEELLERMPRMKLAGDAEKLRSNFIGGIKHMPVTF